MYTAGMGTSVLSGLPPKEHTTDPSWMHYVNKVLGKLRSPVDLRKRFDHREDMVSLEQVANFELLGGDLLERNVPGAFVELGCYIGSTAVVFARMLKTLDPARPFHVYDRFDIELGSVHGIRHLFEENMRHSQMPMPAVHAGDILQLVPAELPDAIALAHIDLGTGGSTEAHTQLIEHALNAVYPRLSPGGLLLLMDYHVDGATLHGNDSNPGVRIATDRFLEDKPEKMHLLYGGPCSHAYLRKQ